MKLANFGDFDVTALEKNYNEAKKDDNFKKLVSRLNLSDEILMKYTSKLIESVEELKNCEDCPGLHMCKNRIKGFVYYPHVRENKHVLFDSIACKYMQKVFKEEDETCDYYEMPEELKRASMKDIDIKDANRVSTIKWLKSFYDSYQSNPHQKGLYLNDSFGSGKTYLTCAMLNELAKKNVDIIVVYYPELLRSLKETFGNPESDFASRMDKLKKVSVLFLDDIGAESVTSWARDEILGTILQYRMDAKLPTFFTSNLNLEELEIHLSATKGNVDKVKARRIIERIKLLTEQVELISKNRRN